MLARSHGVWCPSARAAARVPREMQLIRRFEEKVIERFRAGELAGFLHACIGQEAIAVGVCRALGDRRRDGIDASRARTCDRERDAAE